MKNGNAQSAATLNQIDQTKPNVPQTETTITGYIGGSFNGGINKFIEYIPIMAGQKIKQLNCTLNLQMLTPLTPVFQRLRGEIKTFFVPNSRVWKNAEAFQAQRGGSTETKIEEIPNLGGKIIPWYKSGENYIGAQNTTFWRDSYISSYLPRQGRQGLITEAEKTTYQYEQVLPPISVLPLRGARAIYNDFLRNKEYDTAQTEYNDDTVSDAEWSGGTGYIISDANNAVLTHINWQRQILRARRNNSYYTNYRTELQGQETELAFGTNDATSLLDWISVENKAGEIRTQAENAQKNTWDIIAEIRGSTKLSEGKVQLLGVKNFEINYNSITQSAYNTNEGINEEFRVMGKQGAYSYTFLNTPIMAGYEAREEGYIHVLIHVYADTVFESGYERDLLNIKWDSRYRPELTEQKEDVLYEIEMSTAFLDNNGTTPNFEKAVGFKRKFSEIFKLPNCVNGDMTTKDYIDMTNQATMGEDIIIGKSTYQFYQESADDYFSDEDERVVNLDIWKDYTDILINKNLAIKQPEVVKGNELLYIRGENQIIYGGQMSMDTILPVDSVIMDNYTTWGEH